MIVIDNINNLDFDSIPIDSFWNTSPDKEQKMHRIHAYPAKFPAFITTKALEFARYHKIEIKNIADVFCGCGTVAFESKRNNIPFWGCDINPVATLIAKAKSNDYHQKYLDKYYESILKKFEDGIKSDFDYQINERLLYWYDSKNSKELFILKRAIDNCIPKNSKYRLFFLCAFSNILKSTSYWLTKSIKPQIDPNKKPADVIKAFKEQYRIMINANNECYNIGKARTKIINENFLKESLNPPVVDMIITSPPYVTSYEYADLHQLSTLWLGYAEDYREFRKGSIGSLYHIYDFDKELNKLNSTGEKIVFELHKKHKSKARSVAKYFLDMQLVTDKCHKMISSGGLALFVIGNTEYKGVRIDNIKHLAESLQNSGFNKLYITKRKIQQKILTPYRNELGRFSNCATSRKVYSEEFILVGIKQH